MRELLLTRLQSCNFQSINFQKETLLATILISSSDIDERRMCSLVESFQQLGKTK